MTDSIILAQQYMLLKSIQRDFSSPAVIVSGPLLAFLIEKLPPEEIRDTFPTMPLIPEIVLFLSDPFLKNKGHVNF